MDLVREAIFQLAWARNASIGGLHLLECSQQEFLAVLAVPPHTHLHLEQLFPTLVPPEPVQMDQCLSLQPGSPRPWCGRVVQLHIQGVPVLVQGPGLERKQLQIPYGKMEMLKVSSRGSPPLPAPGNVHPRLARILMTWITPPPGSGTLAGGKVLMGNDLCLWFEYLGVLWAGS